MLFLTDYDQIRSLLISSCNPNCKFSWNLQIFNGPLSLQEPDQKCNGVVCDCKGLKGKQGTIGLPGFRGYEGPPGVLGPMGPPGRGGEWGDPGEYGGQGEKGHRVSIQICLLNFLFSFINGIK